jgi:hypothetical protein
MRQFGRGGACEDGTIAGREKLGGSEGLVLAEVLRRLVGMAMTRGWFRATEIRVQGSCERSAVLPGSCSLDTTHILYRRLNQKDWGYML